MIFFKGRTNLLFSRHPERTARGVKPQYILCEEKTLGLMTTRDQE